jgi:hypothetical protein
VEENLNGAIEIVEQYMVDDINNIIFDLKQIVEPGQKTETRKHIMGKLKNRMKRLGTSIDAVEKLEETMADL